MTSNIDSLLKNADPLVADSLNNALSEKEISIKEAMHLYDAKGLDFHLVGMVADELRKRRVGDTVTFVVSSKGTYTSITVTITVHSKQQLDAIYLDLTACEHVLYAL